MKCPKCHHDLVHSTQDGKVMVRTRGLLMKGGALVCICPKCKSDVPASSEVMGTLQKAAILFFKGLKPPG